MMSDNFFVGGMCAHGTAHINVMIVCLSHVVHVKEFNV